MGYRPGRPSVRLELVEEQVHSCAGCSRYLRCSSNLCTGKFYALLRYHMSAPQLAPCAVVL